MKIIKTLRKNNNLSSYQLAKLTNIDGNMIRQYENNFSKPSLENLIIFSFFFGYSLDYLINKGDTNYPKNLKLLKLAQTIDDININQRYQIESTASSLLNKYNIIKTNFNFDNIDIDLSNNFHKNLKEIRLKKDLTQEELGKDFNISTRMISGYENNVTPPRNKLSYLASKLNISIHCLVTGEKLKFDFDDKHFGETMLKANHFLSFEDQKVIIHLMEAILQTQPATF